MEAVERVPLGDINFRFDMRMNTVPSSVSPLCKLIYLDARTCEQVSLSRYYCYCPIASHRIAGCARSTDFGDEFQIIIALWSGNIVLWSFRTDEHRLERNEGR